MYLGHTIVAIYTSSLVCTNEPHGWTYKHIVYFTYKHVVCFLDSNPALNVIEMAIGNQSLVGKNSMGALGHRYYRSHGALCHNRRMWGIN